VEIISVPNILISSTLHNAGKTEIFKNYNFAPRQNQLRDRYRPITVRLISLDEINSPTWCVCIEPSLFRLLLTLLAKTFRKIRRIVDTDVLFVALIDE
jgi:hypothetical protein